MEVAEAYSLIDRAVTTGRVANGYLVVGDVRGNCDELMRLALAKFFPATAATYDNPDVFLLEPQGKSRTIKVERGKDDEGPGIRDGIIEPVSLVAFAGGWKVGIVRYADRMQNAAANAFLKTLEEPPPKTVFFLLTDRPDSILATIISRTQRIDLKLPEDLLDEDDAERVADAFAARDAAALAAILKDLKENAEATDSALVVKRFYKTIMSFVRRLMIGDRLERYRAFINLEAVEEAYRRSERYLNDEAVLSYMLDRMTFA